MSEALSSHVPWWQSVVVHLFHRHRHVPVSSVTPSTGTLSSGWAGLCQLALVTALTWWEAQTPCRGCIETRGAVSLGLGVS